MITGGDLRQSRLDVGYKTFTISPWGNTITDNDLAFTLSHMDMIPTYGTSGHDHILNNGFNNRLVFGYDGNDILYGSSGSDIIYGGKGNDRFDNRLGNDYMYGIGIYTS